MSRVVTRSYGQGMARRNKRIVRQQEARLAQTQFLSGDNELRLDAADATFLDVLTELGSVELTLIDLDTRVTTLEP